MFRPKSKDTLQCNSNPQTPDARSLPVPLLTGPSLSHRSSLPALAPTSPTPRPPPVTEQVVLSWSPTNTGTNAESTPREAPPAYAVARGPVRPIQYQFSSLGNNSMILLPPAGAPDTRPVYHIAVSMNCFVPYSYITTLRRGGSEAGEYVGDFELGTTYNTDVRTPTICLRGREYPMTKSIRIKHFGNAQRTWNWAPYMEDQSIVPKFTWNFTTNGGRYSCKMGVHPYSVLATFIPPVNLRRRNRPAELPILEVTPEGHKYFDDILVSLLVIERQRNVWFPTS